MSGLWIFWFLAAAVVVAAAISLARLRDRQGAPEPAPQASTVTMREVWTDWIRFADLPDGERARRRILVDQLENRIMAAVERGLIEFEAAALASAEPLVSVRKELMAAVDRRMLNTGILELPREVRERLRKQSEEVLQSDSQARVYIAANEVRLSVLREYSKRRFGDFAENDWFDVYEKASRLKQRSARNFIQRSLSGNQTQAEDARYQTMALVDSQIKARLLRVPAGTSFPGLNERPLATPAAVDGADESTGL